MFKETHVKYSPIVLLAIQKLLISVSFLSPIKMFFLLITYKHIVRITHSIYNEEEDSERINLNTELLWL